MIEGIMVQAAVDRLHDTIETFNKQSADQTKWMLRLTWAIAILTFVMTVAVGAQIYLALNPVR